MGAPSTAAGLAPGTLLGPYEILAPLGAGGMATLYLGRRTVGLARHVAIKVVHAHLARDPSFVSMFLDEARLAARIQHPNVVHTEELGDERGLHYIAMEYLRGCSLGELLQKLAEERKGLSPELAAHIAMKVADGLHAAHELVGDDGQPLGVVHRDVSPQNVFLTYEGQVKLLDFGVAKVRGRDRGTLMGSLKGKIRYMAPEQAASQPVDRRTDVYALGIVLWECLTHQRLFSGGDDMEALERVKNPHVASPSALAPQIGPGLDGCVMTALAPSPDKRFQTTLAFRRAIGGGCPKALEVDAEEVAGFLAFVMKDEIERQKRELPVLAETGGVRPASSGVTRGGYSMTRESPAVSEAAVRASFAPNAPSSSSGRSRRLPAVAPAPAPTGPWRAAVIASVAIGATCVGVALAWVVAGQFASPSASPPPAPVASTPPPPPPAAPAVMAATGSEAVPTGVDPPPELPPEEVVVEDDEPGHGSTHRGGHHAGDRVANRPGDLPPAWPPPTYGAPPPPYRSPPPGGPAPGPGPAVGPGPGRAPDYRGPPPTRLPPGSGGYPASGGRVNN